MIETSGAGPSLEATYRQHRLELVRLAYLLTGSRETAEDIVHIVFLEVQARWRAIERPLPYLRRAVVNRANDHLRRRGRIVPVEPAPAVGPPEVDETWDALATLPPMQRQVVVLRFYQDLSLEDIAELLGRPAATVRSDLFRALGRLRKELG